MNPIQRLRLSLGNAAERVGSFFGVPETGLSEKIAGQPTANTQRQAMAFDLPYGLNPTQEQQGEMMNRTQQLGGTNVAGPLNQPGGSPSPSPAPSGGGGGGLSESDLRARGYNDPNVIKSILGNPEQSAKMYEEFFGGQRAGAEDQARKALEAALGVFNAKAEGLRGRIPGIEQARDLRLQGLDTDLQNFLETANREEGSRVGSLEATNKSVEEAYGTAERKTRASAKSLANRLRDLYASSGTLDSTQYRDRNVDQSKEILQALGDVRREGSGKLASGLKEIEDVKGYYGEQRTQQQRQLALAKDKIKQEADSEVQGILADITLTDAQKIEAVTDAQNRLDQRMSDIDSREFQTKQDFEKQAQDTAIKLAELSSKGTSSTYKQTQAKQEALNTATSVIKRLSDQLGGISPQAAKTVFAQFGFDDEEADRLSKLYADFGAGGGNPDEDAFLQGLSSSNIPGQVTQPFA